MTIVHDRLDVRMSARRVVATVLTIVVVLAIVLVATAPAATATAEEDAAAEGGAAEGEELTIDQLRQERSDRAQEFFPEQYEEPSFFRWLELPMVLIGLVMASLLLGAYLWWQPRFARERRTKQRR